MSAVQIQETLTKPLMKTLEIRSKLQKRRQQVENKLQALRSQCEEPVVQNEVS